MSSSGRERVRRSEVARSEKRMTIRAWLLGGFRVSVGSRTITQDAWRLRKAATLVKLLALTPGHRMHREQAMEALWPEASRRAASPTACTAPSTPPVRFWSRTQALVTWHRRANHSCCVLEVICGWT
jgi:hypothetical protein